MHPRWVVVAFIAGVAACGDNLPPDDLIVPISGSRLVVQWHGYEDGSRQAETGEFYDLLLHSRCAPQTWIDGVIRCVPIADDAVYTDDACTNLVGRGLTIADPTVFVGYDWLDTGVVPSRMFTAGRPLETPPTEYYERHGETCLGPFSTPGGILYFALTAEVAGTDVVAIHDGELGEDGPPGDGSLGVEVRRADDGLMVPIGLNDHARGAACSPVSRGDGTVVCAPADAASADTFHDPACREPAVLVVGVPGGVPTTAAVTEPSGCTGYRAVGRELSPPMYRLVDGVCMAASMPPVSRLFAVDAPVELPVLARIAEPAVRRRLQRVILDGGGLRVVDNRMHDTATGADCTHVVIGATERCIPSDLVGATTLYRAGCVAPVLVAVVPERTCEPVRFAIGNGAEGLEVHAIGDPAADPLYYFDGFGCQPYIGPAVRALGPAIDPHAFASAVLFGERGDP